MKSKEIKSTDFLYSEKWFLIVTSLISFIIATLYFFKGYKEQFHIRSWIVITLNLLYIPSALIFKKKCFSFFYLFYSIVLIFITAFHDSCLYNNFTCLFMIFIIIMITPNFRIQALSLYFISVTIAYVLNEEPFYLYLIHITRSIWFYYIFNFVLGKKYNRKALILYEDEIKILTQLSKNRLQKSIQFEGYSESTVYRRLKAAMKRNNLSKQDLLEAFRKEYSNLLETEKK